MSMTDIGGAGGGGEEADDTPGGIPPVEVEDRPSVGAVSPDDYPDARDGSNKAGGAGDPSPG